jgi:hypothetical protein
MLQVSREKTIDAARRNTADGRMSNDPRGTGMRPNARLVPSVRGGACKLRALKKINIGDEVLCSYGASYWKNKLKTVKGTVPLNNGTMIPQVIDVDNDQQQPIPIVTTQSTHQPASPAVALKRAHVVGNKNQHPVKTTLVPHNNKVPPVHHVDASQPQSSSVVASRSARELATPAVVVKRKQTLDRYTHIPVKATLVPSTHTHSNIVKKLDFLENPIESRLARKSTTGTKHNPLYIDVVLKHLNTIKSFCYKGGDMIQYASNMSI